MAYLKPQTPLKDLNSGDYFYPLTTIDQVQKSDGSRVQDYDLGNVALEDSETVPGPGTPQMTTLMNMVYPVGSIYMSVNATSPASLFGGTWESLGGRFLIGQNGTYTAGSTGGSTTMAHTHTLSHTHSVTAAGTVGNHTLTVNEIPSHGHSVSVMATGYSEWQDSTTYETNKYSIVFDSAIKNPPAYGGPTANRTYVNNGTASNTGGGGAHNHSFSGSAVTSGNASTTTTSGASDANNMPPYLAVYMWKRTA